MAFSRKINSRVKAEENSGFGTNSNSSGGRFYNRDGRPNVIRKGVPIFHRFSWYHTMLNMSRTRFILLLFASYIAINLVFAGIYYLIGVEHLQGIIADTKLDEFTEVFFFSTQTFTTVGYGRISPIGFGASCVATFEAFLGLLNIAIATGLFYGRFSRPQAFLKFSDNALIAPFREGTALMFRFSPFKNNTLSEAEVKATLAMTLEENGKWVDKFYPLDLQISKINSLVLSWTIVHPINEQSPLWGFSAADIANTDIELIVYVQAFDEIFSNMVVCRTSYTSSEIKWGAKFKMMYYPSADKNKTILDLSKLNEYEPAEINTSVSAVQDGA